MPRVVDERAMQMVWSLQGSALSPADSLVVDQHLSKQHWVDFNVNLLDDTPQGMDLVELSELWNRANKLFHNLEKDEQFPRGGYTPM